MIVATSTPVQAATQSNYHDLKAHDSGFDLNQKDSLPAVKLLPKDDVLQRQASGAENFNPGLEILPPLPIVSPKPTLPAEPEERITPVSKLERIKLDSIKTDFKNEQDSFGQENQLLETTLKFRIHDDQKLLFKTGVNSFVLPGVDRVINIPLQVGWQGKVGLVKVESAIGVDWFDRLPTAINLHLGAEIPISPSATVSFVVDQEPYKSSAKVLENGVSSWRYGPSFYWQIDPKTSFFSMYRLGHYNDGNFEQQSFSRLERKIGQFSVSTNLFAWNYRQDMQQRKGYFSPPDFLVYNAELAWEGDLFKFLHCQLAGTVGRQRLNGEISPGNTYHTRCTVKISPQVELDLGYAASSVRKRDTGASGSSSREITSQLRVSF